MTERNPGDTIPTDSDRTEPRSVCVQPQATNTGVVSGQTSEINRPPGGIVAGGAGFASIDPMDPKDQAMVRKAVGRWPKRWRGIDAAKKDRFVEGLMSAHDKALSTMNETQNPELAMQATNLVLSAIRTAAVLEGQNQADDHLEDKNERLDSGKITERIETPVRFIKGTDGSGV